MDENILSYRRRHPRCKYCLYSKIVSKGLMLGIPEYYVCKVKDKVLDDDFFWNLRGCFCKWFKPEEGEK